MKADVSSMGNRGLVIASVVFVLIVGAIFFSISGGMFGGADPNEGDEQVAVTDVFASRSVRMTVEGPIVANEERESYRVEVGLDKRTVEAFRGYDTSLVGNSELGNNRRAYTEFVHALSRAGFDETRNVSDEAADERGVCAGGRQYIFEILDNGRSLVRRWTTSCEKNRGNLGANVKEIKSLFDKQIPDRSAALGSIRLR